MLKIEQTAKAPEDRLCIQLSAVVAMFASEHKPWFEVYRAAMLELDSERLPERIVAAKEAVQMRLKEIQGPLTIMRNDSKLKTP